MSLKKVSCMFAIGMLMIFFSTKAASACAHHPSPVAHNEHVGEMGGNASEKIGERAADLSIDQHRRSSSELVHIKPSKTATSFKVTAVVLQDDWEEAARCIHATECTCRGRKSHRSNCGTNADCETHPGLICTWADGI